jgi:hypothetical protein
MAERLVRDPVLDGETWCFTFSSADQAMKVKRRFKDMNIFGRAAGVSRPGLGNQILGSVLSLVLVFTALPQNLWAYQDQGAQAPAQDAQAQAAAPAYTQQTPEQLQQLVAPIALYPDSLVAQILAASTFPEQVVEADRWVQAHPDLKGVDLGKAVDQLPWDPSVKALAAFPSVLGNMDKNLSWTSSLGDAYYNQQQDVMDAVQVMRRKARDAGNLKSTPQQTVTEQDSAIDIEPADPDEVYIPAYDPWLVYGGPIVAWPGWYPYPGIWFGGPYLSFGLGFGIGWWGGFGWGWGHWGFDWHNHYAMFNNGRYYSGSRTFYNRGNFYRGGVARGGAFNRPGAAARPFEGNGRAARGYAEPRGQSSTRSGAFSGYGHGGQARSFSSRGSASMGGGGGARGGGGGRR